MDKAEIDAYLAKIRKTIAESRAVVGEAQLRIQETDRLLERQGLTREEVLNFRVNREHRLAVNEELRRRGLPPLEEEDEAFDFTAATEQLRRVSLPDPEAPASEDELAERRRKFGNFMREYRL